MNILLIDGGQHFGHSAGRLNHTLHQTARDTLTALDHAVKETVIEAGYDKDAEVEKWLWMVGENKLVANAARHRANPTEGYGTGGLLHGKKHMISSTWNAPIEAFTREGDFFEGAGVDGVYLHFHKANEFLGTTRLPSFICNDVIKNPQVERYLADYRAHLEKVFGKV